MILRSREAFCPECRARHVAKPLHDEWLAFVCCGSRYLLPFSFPTLGTPEHAEFKKLHLSWEMRRVGCLNCSHGSMSTDPEDGVEVHYICYRCGTVGSYFVEPGHEPEPEVRPEPDREPCPEPTEPPPERESLFEHAPELTRALPEPVPVPEPQATPAPESWPPADHPSLTWGERMRARWEHFSRWLAQ